MTDTKHDHLPPYRVRPRFKIETNYTVTELVDKVRQTIEEESTVKARIIEGHATLYIPEEDRHYWSPQLTLSVSESETGSILRGIYGPRPSVWTMFIFFYSFIGFIILVIALFGLSNWSLGNPAPILWAIPFLIVVFLTLYLISFFGQKLGHDQMVILHEFVEKSIGRKIR